MPPRSPAGPPMRRRCRDREGDPAASAADWKQQQQDEQHQGSSQFSRLARGTPVSFSAMETTAEEAVGEGDSDDDAAEPPGGGGGGALGSRWLGSREALPSFFHSSAVATASASAADFLSNSDSSSETSGSSAVSDQAMMELSAHDEGDGEEDDVVPMGIFIPALDRASTSRRGLGSSFADDAGMWYKSETPCSREKANSSSSCSSGTSSAGGSSCTRRIGHFRALSSQCLEGLDWGDTGKHHRRERSESEPRVSQGVCVRMPLNAQQTRLVTYVLFPHHPCGTVLSSTYECSCDILLFHAFPPGQTATPFVAALPYHTTRWFNSPPPLRDGAPRASPCVPFVRSQIIVDHCRGLR